MSSSKPLIFAEQPVSDTPVTTFDLSHELKTSLDPGQLCPILVEDTLPSDIFHVKLNSFLRLAPLTFPVFHRIDAYTHAFFVPNRILWDSWNEFIWNGNGKVKLVDQSSFVAPLEPFFAPNFDYVTHIADKLSAWKGSTAGSFGFALKCMSYLLTGYSYQDVILGSISNPEEGAYKYNTSAFLRETYDYAYGSKSLLDYLGITRTPDYERQFQAILLLVSHFGHSTRTYAFNGWMLGDYTNEASFLGHVELAEDVNSLFSNSTDSMSEGDQTFDSLGDNLYEFWRNSRMYFYVNGDWEYCTISNFKSSVSLAKLVTQGAQTFTYSFDYTTSAGVVNTVSDTLSLAAEKLANLRRVCELFSVIELYYQNQDFRFSALPFRAYRAIYNEYYRDQNSDTYLDYSTSSGRQQPSEFFKLAWTLTRCYEHDYFTSCFQQQSRQNYLLPVGLQQSVTKTAGAAIVSNNGQESRVTTDASFAGTITTKITGLLDDLRTMMHLQRLSDKVTRAGSRIRESIQSLFPNTDIQDISPDQPVYIAGSSFPVTISEVTQTSQSTDTHALGDYAGHGVATGCDLDFDWTCKEHGFIFVISSIRPRSGYSQGMPKMYDRRSYLDYALPDLATLGDQPVYNSEIFASSRDPRGVFGYIPRYSEYKFRGDRLSGTFRDPWTMSSWHLSRLFLTQPQLNTEFLHVNGKEMDRIFAYEDDDYDHYFGVFYIDMKTARPLPMYSIPTF